MAVRDPIISNDLARKTVRGKAVIAQVIAILVGLLLGTAGVLKVSGFAKFADAYNRGGQPHWVFFGSGVIEIAAGLALFVPRTRSYAAWCLLAMIFLVAWKPWSVHEMSFLVPQCLAIGGLVLLLWPLRPKNRAEI